MLKTLSSLIPEIRKSIQCIPADEGIAQCQAEGGVLIDVREPAEFTQKSANNAINIPRGVLEMKALELYPDASQPIYIHCATGARASLAAEQLVRLGYQNVWAITCKLDDVFQVSYTKRNKESIKIQ
ncbi:rhodanese-like domain-containing protein [Thalassomonas viridans]|uniref:Rhodanese-like domain-containing protein n=1 Tax=Thalassomonas viridans TaxID=137584 RepID=A0AAE9Z9F7_9GAMM|nr:rhodanese-like domain-containing protein [Thalassomonas viridans]WDE08480.1 rhodanese-like domain-containing protein [Thalassomonas viridans]